MAGMVKLTFWGAGAFSKVYTVEGREDIVVKRCKRIEEDGYGIYLDFILHNQNKCYAKHMPKIHKILYFQHKKELVVIQEKLYTEPNTNTVVPRLNSRGKLINNNTNAYNRHHILRFVANKTSETTALPIADNSKVEILTDELSAISKKLNVRFDLHSENYMYREDGTIVITDPFSYIETACDSDEDC